MLLAILGCGLPVARAGAVDHLLVSGISSPQRAGSTVPVTITARDASGALAQDFNGPVQVFFADGAQQTFYEDFEDGLAGWSCNCAGGGSFWPYQYDTDGDGTVNGALRAVPGGQPCTIYTTLSLEAGTTYNISFDLAASGPQRVYVDAVLNVDQVGVWELGPTAAGERITTTAQTAYTAPATGSYLFCLRFWLPLGGPGSVAYVDNIRVRPREVQPFSAWLNGGQWSGELTFYRPGTNLVLRTVTNQGQVGDSEPFDVLAWLADLSVSFPEPQVLPAGVQTRFRLVISNSGPSMADGLLLTNELPAGCAFIASEPYVPWVVSPTLFFAPMPAVSPGATLEMGYVVRQDKVGDYPVSAWLNALPFDAQPANNSASTTLHFVPLLQGGDVTVTEAPGGTNATFLFRLSAPSDRELLVNCSVVSGTAVAGIDFLNPAEVALTFHAGETQQSLVVPVLDDSLYEPAKAFTVTLAASPDASLLLERNTFTGTILDDEPLPTLAVSLPESAVESAGTLVSAGKLSLTGAFDRDVLVTLASSDTGELTVPATVVLPAGQTAVSFDLRLVDDAIFDRTQTVTVTASSTNGLSCASTMAVTDDDLPDLGLIVIRDNYGLLEGRGWVTNALRVSVPVAVDTNVAVTLVSSDETELQVPPTAVIPAGQVFVYTSLVLPDDMETDGPQLVTITATAPGFASAAGTFSVLDDDLHHFSVGLGQGDKIRWVTSNVPFVVTIRAVDVTNNAIYTFTNAADLRGTGDLGTPELQPTRTTAFSRGYWSGQLMITNGANENVRVIVDDGAGHTGQSAPITVFASPAQQARFVGVEMLGGDMLVRFSTVAGRSYRMESTSVPGVVPWGPLVPAITGTGEVMTITNTVGPLESSRFYRLVLQPPP